MTVVVNDRDFEIMRALAKRGRRWSRPMDIGARDASYHSNALKKLARYGFVERARRDTLMNAIGSRRGSYVYRITAAGRRELRR